VDATRLSQIKSLVRGGVRSPVFDLEVACDELLTAYERRTDLIRQANGEMTRADDCVLVRFPKDVWAALSERDAT
jgi:hypothetical protein